MGSTRTFNLADLFEIVADAVPERECLVCDDLRLTYRQVDARTNRLAHWMHARGIGPDDHVAIYLSNGVEYLEAMIAAFKLRAVPINVNYRYVESELHYVLEDSDARAVIFHRRFAPVLGAVAGNLPALGAFVYVDDGDEVDVDLAGAQDYDSVLASSSPARDFPPRSSEDLYILYTGGTTGMPKGVMWRHDDIFFAAFGGGNPGGDPVETPEELARRAQDGHTRSLPASPFMHGTAHWMAFAALAMGGTVVISGDRHLDPDRLWRLVAREQVNFLTIVGDAFARPLVDALDRLEPGTDVSCCRVILSGGAILSPSVKEALAQRLPGTLVVDGYGASETGGQGTSVTVAGAPATGPRFVVNDETTVLGDDLRPVAPGSGVVGKLARRGHVPLGYYKDPERTARTFPVIDGVRWAIPGDNAVVEADGTITLLGRGSVSINTGGEKVYPEEVEAALKAHPEVFDAVVVGVPDERWGERVVAVVEPRPGAAPSFAALDAHVRGLIAGYKAPRDVVLVERVERAPSGKPDYRWARDTACARSGIAATER